MPKRKKQSKKLEEQMIDAPVTEQAITDTLKTNYMPYAMSVIISRAIPEIDGFKPSHRKLLYTMYKMGLLTGNRTKSANVVGQTMKLNPHGDASIYETLVRLTRGNEALLHPFIDSKGSFGKQYSDMAFAASRYTEVKLDSFCEEIFKGIDKDAVDFIDNYDSTMKEPVLLPSAFPNILVSPNIGIAVGMASNICSFNLAEICDGVCAIMNDPDVNLLDIIKAPDFSTGGFLLYDRKQLEEIYKTGRGTFRLRAKYSYNKKNNCIEITQIPYTTRVEIILDKIAQLVKGGKIKEITDARDETGIEGLCITIDLKRGTDPEALMARLFRQTTLEDSFSCNFNVLIAGKPIVIGVKELLEEWLAWRTECVMREHYFMLGKMKDKLHLLYGLREILLDIDKAVKIIRETESEKDVIKNLMTGFSIDEIQAEYIAEIKLRNLNKEYILNRISETENLEEQIEDTEKLLSSKRKIHSLIAKQLCDIKKKHGKPRKTQLLYADDLPEVKEPEPEIYPVHLILTEQGYIKKIIPPKSGNVKKEQHALKEDDRIIAVFDTVSNADLLFFSDKAQVYKAKPSDFDEVKPSSLGDFVSAKLSFDKDENLLMMCPTTDYKGYAVFFFKNGKAIKNSLSFYETKTNRRKLTSAYNDVSEPAGIFYLPEDAIGKDCYEFLLVSSAKRAILINSDQIIQKATRTAGGVFVFSLKKGQMINNIYCFAGENKEQLEDFSKYRKIKLPSTGNIFDINEEKNQLSFEL